MNDLTPLAVTGGNLFTDLADVTDDPAALDSSGIWVVVAPYQPETGGGLTRAGSVFARFRNVRPATPWPGAPWVGPAPDAWISSLSQEQFRSAVQRIRANIAAGDVYQVNLTRVLSAPLPGGTADVAALGAALATGNPAPYSAVVRLPKQDVYVASASPESFLSRNGQSIRSSPIKGTASDPSAFLAKDRAENVMIVDLVRNDLGRVCEWGSIRVPSLLDVEPHPGLFHLVSTVEGRLRTGAVWSDILGATFPPGSVTGAPKIAACSIIDQLEPVDRHFYCGAIGWVDADRQLAELNVAIRTFWIDDGHLRFGTGGAITWDSDPDGEWEETELKARRLISIASGTATETRRDRAARVGARSERTREDRAQPADAQRLGTTQDRSSHGS